MRFTQYINEEYVGSLPNLYAKEIEPTSIYVNPSSSDIKEIMVDTRKKNWSRHTDRVLVRLIIDIENKNLFVFDSDGGIHYRALEYLAKEGKIKMTWDNRYDIFCDIGKIDKGKLYCDRFISMREYLHKPMSAKGERDRPEHRKLYDETKKRFQWAKRYFANEIDFTV